MPANDIVQLSVSGVVGGQAHVHTLHFRFKTGDATDAGIAANWVAEVGTNYRACFPTTDRPSELVTVRQVCGVPPLRAPAANVPLNVLGTRDVTGFIGPAPTWLALVATEHTAFGGRRYRGRSFFGGVQEDDISGNNFITTAPPANYLWNHVGVYLQDLIDTYGPTGTNLDYQLFMYSRRIAELNPASACDTRGGNVTGFTRRVPIASMKSRKPGSGG